MANVTVTAVRAILVGGTPVAVGETASIPEALARELVWLGDVTCSELTADPVQVTPGVVINAESIANSTAAGRAVLKAATAAAARTALGASTIGANLFTAADIAAVLTALGASFGANDSGGAGFKVLRFPNAT